MREETFSNWESILAEIVGGDSFGADRIDYLVRDSLHAGVLYGSFAWYRLLECLRVLPRGEDDSWEPMLGVEEGGLHSAEAMTLARCFMYKQVYFHSVRISYDLHLRDFLSQWLPNGNFPSNYEHYLYMMDHEVVSAIYRAFQDEKNPAHQAAEAIVKRKHFRSVEIYPQDLKKNPQAQELLFKELCYKFSSEEALKAGCY